MKELKRLILLGLCFVGLWVVYEQLTFAVVKDPATIKTDATADLATNTEMFLQPTIDVIDSINIKFADVTAMKAGGANLPDETIVCLVTHTSGGDNGGGFFELDTSGALGASAEDDGFIIESAGGSNWYWLRIQTNDIATPEMFGAVADGTTDDSAKIQAAIDAGKVVILTPGKTYLVDAELTVTTGTTIHGNGGTLKTGPALAVTGGAMRMFVIDGDDDVTFEGIRFVGNGADPPLGPFERYIDVTNLTDPLHGARALTVENCIFEEANVAILARVLTQSAILNNRFFNFTANQIYLRQGCVGNTISGNVFDDNGAQGIGNHTIDIEANAGEVASTGNTVTGNSVQSCGTPCQLTGTECYGNTVTGNTFINTSGDSLNGLGMKTSNTGRNTVSGNTIIGPLYGVNEGAQGGTVYTGNTIIGRRGISLNNGSSTSAGPSSIVGNVIIADEPGTHSGIAQAGTPSASEITLQATATAANRAVASATDDSYNMKMVTITGGTGSGQSSTITDYTGATKVADVSPSWSPTPDATSTYDVLKITGTCQAGSTSSTIKLATTASATDDTFNLERVKITGGTGTLGEFRRIADYTGATRVADVEPNWTVTPDGTTTYEVLQTIDGIAVNTPGHTISGNTIRDFHIDGIDGEAAAANNLRVLNNDISGIGRYAFRFDDDENLIAGNVISEGIQVLWGAFVSGNDNVILENEFINNLGGSGSGTSRNFIRFQGGTGNLVRASLPSRVQNLAEDTNVIETGGLAIETVTNGSPALSTEGSTMLDSAGGAITATLGSGTYAGQTKYIRMIDATTSSTVSVTLHVTSNPEIFTFDAVDETLELEWSGSEWITVYTVSGPTTFIGTVGIQADASVVGLNIDLNATPGDAFTVIDSGASTLFVVDESGNVGIGTGSPVPTLHLVGGSGITNGIQIQSSETDASVKVANIKLGHYTNAEEPVLIFSSVSTSTGSELFFGGGTVSHNAATSIAFYTAVDNVTVSGTERMVIDSTGDVGVGVSSPNELLQVDDAISISSDAEGSTARLTRRTSHETHTLANAATSDTTTISIPTNCKLLAVSFTVNTTIVDDGGDDTWSAAFVTGSTQILATAAAAAQNTKVNTWHPIYEISSGISEVRFTANGGSFTAGVIEIVSYYEELTSLAN